MMKRYSLFLNNPEFTRNLWSNFSLIGIGLSLFLSANLLLFAHYNLDSFTAILNVYLGLFLCIVGFWGSNNVINAFLQEFKQGTWDYQRLSSISPMQMLLGKLFGAACMQWLIGLILFMTMQIHFSFLSITPAYFARSAFIYWAILSLIILTIQSNVLMNFLLMWRKGSTKTTRKIRSSSATWIFLIIAIFFMPWGSHDFWSSMLAAKTIRFFGLYINEVQYILIITISLSIWCMIGLYNLFRSEFGQKVSPLWWAGFLLFSIIMFGFTQFSTQDFFSKNASLSFFSITAMFCAASIYLTLYYTNKDASTWIRLGRYWQYNAREKLFYSIPTWLTSYLFTIIFAIIACIIIYTEESAHDATRALLITLSFLLFITRDIVIVLYFNLARKNTYLIFIFLLLYLSYPLNLNIIPAGLFFPSLNTGMSSLILAIFSPMIQTAIFILLFKMNWHKFMPSFKEQNA